MKKLDPLKVGEGAFKRFQRKIIGVCCSVPLFTLLIFLNGIQTLSLSVRPFSQGLFRKINRELADFWWGLCVTVAKRVHGVKVIFTGDPIPPKENAVVISNHLETTDIPILFFLAKSKERLGDIKWFLKDILKYVPGVGWGMLFLGNIFVKRSWQKDKKNIENTFKGLNSTDMPFWVISFCEGTRLTKSKLAKAQRYAKEKGVTPFKEVLYPRTKGFVTTVTALRGRLDAIYDVTIGYPNGVPTLWSFFQGYAKKVYVHITRVPIDKIPVSDKDLSKWLLDQFVQKDERLISFYANRKFVSQET